MSQRFLANASVKALKFRATSGAAPARCSEAPTFSNGDPYLQALDRHHPLVLPPAPLQTCFPHALVTELAAPPHTHPDSLHPRTHSHFHSEQSLGSSVRLTRPVAFGVTQLSGFGRFAVSPSLGSGQSQRGAQGGDTPHPLHPRSPLPGLLFPYLPIHPAHGTPAGLVTPRAPGDPPGQHTRSEHEHLGVEACVRTLDSDRLTSQPEMSPSCQATGPCTCVGKLLSPAWMTHPDQSHHGERAFEASTLVLLSHCPGHSVGKVGHALRVFFLFKKLFFYQYLMRVISKTCLV